MAVKDTHKAFERLRGAGYSKEMAEALLDTFSESWDALATKADIESVREDTKADIESVREDLKALETANRAELREQELRIRLHLYAVAIVVIGVLATLELLPR